MTELSDQRCYHHIQREAVVRCPDCGYYFCRECVTEHEDRMLCNRCLAKRDEGDRKRSGPWVGRVLLAGQGVLGFLVLWYAFYLLGASLVAIPHAFHEGTILESGWWGKP